MIKTTIITLTWNKLEKATKPFIDSLYKHTRSDDFKLIVVDNGSSDGTLSYLKDQVKQRGNIVLIANKENLGYSVGNNQGLSEMSPDTDIVGLVNNDILFTPEWLHSVKSVILQNEKIGLASPRINTWRHINQMNYMAKYKNLLGKYKTSFSKSLAPNFCCVFMRKAVFDSIGYLDEEFTPAFFEDDDYSLRSLYLGYINGFINSAFLFHNHCTTSGSLAGRKALLERNRQLFYEKHYLGQYIYELEAWKKRPIKTILNSLLNRVMQFSRESYLSGQ